ncbi:hypothetical protein GCM10007972_26690 [Iodidimonas muriae]|uniref:DUF1269 domain-containing protein n=1 Tax=Iodidimonas muriae TaxID=261467 RepID=A0ABQ2LGA5_9PROT|nr:hypothetical protein [Iodidimonas muriae]GER08690.1 hypothetical protein JCM17843_30000 [Kordiimonadales bacterium JCM 17843]GGO16998.1 hypothetical protein GCM10007972_26690 [Iodidimonas muriae]
MMTDVNEKPVREAVAVFETVETLQEAIDDLLSSNFDRAELSLLAGEHAVEEKLGHVYKKIEELEDDPNVPTVAYISTESIGDAKGALIGAPMYIAACTAAGIAIAVGGPLAAAITAGAAAGGAGAIIGGVLASIVGKHHADYLHEQLEHGGLILWVRTKDAEHEERAKRILAKHSAHDVHVHG